MNEQLPGAEEPRRRLQARRRTASCIRAVRHPLPGKTGNQYTALVTNPSRIGRAHIRSDTLQAACRICPYSAATDASIDPNLRQLRRVVRRFELNAIPLHERWLP